MPPLLWFPASPPRRRHQAEAPAPRGKVKKPEKPAPEPAEAFFQLYLSLRRHFRIKNLLEDHCEFVKPLLQTC